MITRIVKLTFNPEHTANFLEIFEESKGFISSFEGNVYLSLMNDKSNENIFFTISQWKSEDALEAYRNSDYFANVWARTKVLFAAKAEAWTLNQIEGEGIWQNQ